LPPEGANLRSYTAVMISNRTGQATLFCAPSFPDSGHTCVSCPRQIPRYPHNNPWPKNDCPSTACSSNSETGETTSPKCVPSTGLTDLVLMPSPGLSPPDALDPAAHSAPSHCILHIRKSFRPQLRRPPLPPWLRSETDTSALIQHDTENALAFVITFEICSLLPPYVRPCGNNLAYG
jgi:hypothetical protein